MNLDWITTANQIVTLIVATVGLIGTFVGAITAIVAWVKNFKNKSFQEKLASLKRMADGFMKEAEASGKSGADKKTMVIESIKQACLADGLDISMFLDKLNIYIDESIKLVNDMNNAKKD